VIDEGVVLLDQVGRRGVVASDAGHAYIGAGARRYGDIDDAERGGDERDRETPTLINHQF
jgi:hypothetical protein